MHYFETLIHEAVQRKQRALPVSEVTGEVGSLYSETSRGLQVTKALRDPFFPLTLYLKHHLPAGDRSRPGAGRAAQDLSILSQMFLRIRKDIDRCFGNREATCVDLNGDAAQELAGGQWCSLCGDCCQLPGTVPDPPDPVRYPGYWYAYIGGDSPLLQKFCPFLFELPPQGRFFCAIHNVKPLTCLAYGKEDCMKNHPGKAVSSVDDHGFFR